MKARGEAVIDVPVAGGRLATYRLGSPRPDAPSVLAIHGITSSSRTWLPSARALQDRAALIAVDLRGRGRSGELPGPFGLDAHVADMLAVLDHFGLQRAVIAGHSLGAYVTARLAAEHPGRVKHVVLVDGGLAIPGSRDADPERFMQDFLGPSLRRLSMTFPDRAAYRAWWAEHPALGSEEIAARDLDAYAAHDLVGRPPQLRSSVNPDAVRKDGRDLLRDTPDAERLSVPAVLLCATKGMVDDPHPMQPLASAQEWAAADPQHRRALEVPGANHFTIVLGAGGARVVGGEIVRAVAAGDSG